MILEGKVGPATLGDGALAAPRLTRNGSLAVAGASASFQEAVNRGRCFGVANQTGITTQAGLSATTPALTLYNPAGSGVNLAVWYVGVNFTVAFAAAAEIFVAVGTNTVAAAVTGTATTAHRNLKLGSGANMAASPYLAATLPAAPVAIGLLGAGLTGAITTVPGTQNYERWYNGALILTPGTNLSIQTSTASGASATFCEYLWEEFE